MKSFDLELLNSSTPFESDLLHPALNRFNRLDRLRQTLSAMDYRSPDLWSGCFLAGLCVFLPLAMFQSHNRVLFWMWATLAGLFIVSGAIGFLVGNLLRLLAR